MTWRAPLPESVEDAIDMIETGEWDSFLDPVFVAIQQRRNAIAWEGRFENSYRRPNDYLPKGQFWCWINETQRWEPRARAVL